MSKPPLRENYCHKPKSQIIFGSKINHCHEKVSHTVNVEFLNSVGKRGCLFNKTCSHRLDSDYHWVLWIHFANAIGHTILDLEVHLQIDCTQIQLTFSSSRKIAPINCVRQFKTSFKTFSEDAILGHVSCHWLAEEARRCHSYGPLPPFFANSQINYQLRRAVGWRRLLY